VAYVGTDYVPNKAPVLSDQNFYDAAEMSVRGSRSWLGLTSSPDTRLKCEPARQPRAGKVVHGVVSARGRVLRTSESRRAEGAFRDASLSKNGVLVHRWDLEEEQVRQLSGGSASMHSIARWLV
jgi:hypothetical protein